MQSVTSAYVMQNYTAEGWGLTRAPQELVDTIRAAVRGAYQAGNYTLETFVDVIDGQQPIFINRPDLTKRILKELKPFHEAWSGINLLPHLAYGFRLYRNESSLLMRKFDPACAYLVCKK
jgi:hypothetical protein